MERKKLLILGGSFYLLPLIEKAHELGVYVITADYLLTMQLINMPMNITMSVLLTKRLF